MGGGHVARDRPHVGPTGHVTGIDFDPHVLFQALYTEAVRRGGGLMLTLWSAIAGSPSRRMHGAKAGGCFSRLALPDLHKRMTAALA
jgi:hypothetical protein